MCVISCSLTPCAHKSSPRKKASRKHFCRAGHKTRPGGVLATAHAVVLGGVHADPQNPCGRHVEHMIIEAPRAAPDFYTLLHPGVEAPPTIA